MVSRSIGKMLITGKKGKRRHRAVGKANQGRVAIVHMLGFTRDS